MAKKSKKRKHNYKKALVGLQWVITYEGKFYGLPCDEAKTCHGVMVVPMPPFEELVSQALDLDTEISIKGLDPEIQRELLEEQLAEHKCEEDDE